MSETVADRIAMRLAALGLTERAASLAATGSDGTIRNIRTGKSRDPKWETLVKLAPVLQCASEWLQTGEGPMAPGAAPPAPAALPTTRRELARAGIPYPATVDLPVNLPVLGTVAGGVIGRGAFDLTGNIVDYIRRPAALLNAPDAYALFVEGDSMEPRFERGDPVFVHPHRKALPGDYIVIQEPDTDNGQRQGFIKRLVAVTPRLLRTRQYNPPATIDFVIRPGLVWHKVMTEKDLYGL